MATKTYKAVIVYLDPAVARVLKLQSADEGTPMTAMVREAIDEYLIKKNYEGSLITKGTPTNPGIDSSSAYPETDQ